MKKYIFFAGLVLCLSLVSALDMSATTDSNIIVRELENKVTFDLEITDAAPGTYNLYTLADLYLEPKEFFTISYSDSEPYETQFTVRPTENLDVLGYYTFTYSLNHRGVEKIDKKATVNIMKLEDVVEIASEPVDVESGKVNFYVQNRENVNLQNLNAEFSSLLFDTNENFDLAPNEKKTFTVDVDREKLRKTKAGVYVIKSEFETKEGRTEVLGNLYLGEKKGITTTDDTTGFLIRTQTIMKINSGNVLETVEVSIKKNIISRLFTTFSTEPTTIDRNGFLIEYTWIKNQLGPTEIFTVQSRTNYIFPFLVIIFAVLALLGYKRYAQTKVEVTKSVFPVKTKNGEFALRIKLSVRAKKAVENVSLIDRVPAIVKIYRKFGTIKPDKIDAENRRVHWNIGDLNAGEERVFSYIVYSKVGVVGKFSLPGALAVFEKDEKIHEVESNQVFFMNEQVKG